MIVYGASDECNGLGRLGVVVATHPRGEVAHIIYADHRWDHFLVLDPTGRCFFQASLAETRNMSKSERLKRTISPFSNGSNIEFEGEEGTNVVKWAHKAPLYLSVDFRNGSPYLVMEGVSSGTALWTRKFLDITDWIPDAQSVLASVPANAPLVVSLALRLDYGMFEDVEELPIHGFNPTFDVTFDSVWPSFSDASRLIVEQAVCGPVHFGDDNPSATNRIDGVAIQPWNLAPPAVVEAGQETLGADWPPLPAHAKPILPPTHDIDGAPQGAAAIPVAEVVSQEIEVVEMVPAHRCFSRDVVCRIASDEKNHALLKRTGFFDDFMKVLAEEKGPATTRMGDLPEASNYCGDCFA